MPRSCRTFPREDCRPGVRTIRSEWSPGRNTGQYTEVVPSANGLRRETRLDVAVDIGHGVGAFDSYQLQSFRSAW